MIEQNLGASQSGNDPVPGKWRYAADRLSYPPDFNSSIRGDKGLRVLRRREAYFAAASAGNFVLPRIGKVFHPSQVLQGSRGIGEEASTTDMVFMLG